MNKKRKKKNNNKNKLQIKKTKTLQVQNIINTFSKFINIPQLNDDNIDYYYLNDTKGYNTIISSKFDIIDNDTINDYYVYYTDNLIGSNKLQDLLNKTFIIKIFPTDNQKNILLKWMDSYIDMYNCVINKIKIFKKEYNEIHNKILKYNEIPFNFTLNQLKKDCAEYKEELSIKTHINKHILDYAIQDALNALSSIVSNLNKNNIKNSRLRYLKKTKSNKIIKIEGQITSNNSFCSSMLGKILKSEPEINYKTKIKKTAILKYDSKKDKFFLYYKEKINKDEEKDINKIGSFDLGLRTFLTGISNNYTIEYGSQINEHIKKILEKMDKIKKKKTVKDKNKYIKKQNPIQNIKQLFEIKPINKHKLIKNKRKHLLKYEKYLSNYINDVHWQIVNNMTNRFDYIILGNFSTKNMVESDSTSKMNKRIGNALKIYQFKQKLKYKCLIKGCKYKEIDEYMTTQCCSNCSKVNPNIKGKKIFECKNCNHVYDRDINSAKNIFMKSIKC